MSKYQQHPLYERLISNENILLAISSLDSYIQNKELLSKKDAQLLEELHDTFNISTIRKTILMVRNRIKAVMDGDFFSSNVYFKPKKINDDNIVVFRPIHSTNLTEQIAIVSCLQVLVYELDSENRIICSDLGHLLPTNFYGNKLGFDVKHFFKPWQEQYKAYSSKASELLNRYSETREYRYEVSLDLENFFPSISPDVLFHFIASYFSFNADDESKDILYSILAKLLYTRLDSLNSTEIAWYLGPNNLQNYATDKNCNYVLGIPQGLPHSFFLANLYMLKVQEIYEKHFPGKMLFYVDDSVIFTNVDLDTTTFSKKVDLINHDLMLWSKSLPESSFLKVQDFKPSDYYYTSDFFRVMVHSPNKPNSKSTYSSLYENEVEPGERFLRGISRETSKVSSDIFSIYSESEAKALLSKLESIVEAINKELTRINQKPSFESTYKTRLLRYRKYFKYRAKLISYRVNGNIEAMLQYLLSDLHQILNGKIDNTFKAFFEKYNDDILAATVGFVLQKSYAEGIDISELTNALSLILHHIYKRTLKHAYLAQIYDPYFSAQPKALPSLTNNEYTTLSTQVKRKYYVFREQSKTHRYKCFYELVDELSNVSVSRAADILLKHLSLTPLNKYCTVVNANTSEQLRMMLNAIFSYLFGYEINDTFVISKNSPEPIEYAEIRIVCYLRNTQFNLSDLKPLLDECLSDDFQITADYSLLQVLHIFHHFVSHPKWIDTLILVHKYCCDTWRNGSKYLYFYTLHNQEHAVCLIQSTIKIIHNISYFQLKQIDYYILFMACYLHDISMVTLPDMQLLCSENISTSKLYTDFIIDYSKTLSNGGGPREIRKLLGDYYQRIDSFFETTIRGNHARDSAMEIRKHPELSFIADPERELVAEVSAAHGFDLYDIYYLRSTGDTSLINKKQITILLRLADLLDMSRYRVSKLLLQHNLENMNEVSRFHWLSHLVTDGYDFSSHYSLRNSNNDCHIAYGNITENITLTVNVKLSQLYPIDKTCGCKYVSSSIPSQNGSVTIKCNSASSCDTDKCTFLCKWFMKKNSYLIPEFSALQEYLQTLPENYFHSEVSVVINIVEKTSIPADAFDYLRDYVHDK